MNKPADEQFRNQGSQTQSVHTGEQPDARHGAVTPPLVLSTNFLADPDTAGFSANESKPNDSYFYSRWAAPNLHALEEKLAVLEAAEDAVVFASGMAAASGLLLHLLKADDHLVISDVCYAGVAEFARQKLPALGIKVTSVNLADLDAAAKAITPGTTLVYAESPCNPIIRLTDLAAVAKLAHDKGALFAVDSTIATPMGTKPITLGADFVIHSLTKYINGHGDALGGAVIGRRDAMHKLRNDMLIHAGGAMSPFNAYLILRGIATLPLRMKAHEAAALQVAAYLEKHPKIKRVMYPGLRSHPQYELARRQMKNFSSLMTFQIDEPQAVARRLAKKLKVINYAVSLGKQRSLLFYIPTEEIIRSSFGLTGASLAEYKAYAGDGVFRVSVGIEDGEDLIADLDQALAE